MAPRLISLFAVTLTSVIPFIPTIFEAFQKRFVPHIVDIFESTTFEIAFEKGFLNLVYDSQTILLLTIPLIAINACLLLIFTNKFLTKQRLYSQRLRDVSCTIANLVFVLQPSRIDDLRRGDASMASLLNMLSICFCLIGSIVYFEFISRKVFGYLPMFLCFSSFLFFTTGTVIDTSSLSLPIVLIAAVIFNQIKCPSVVAYRVTCLMAVIIVIILSSTCDYDIAKLIPPTVFFKEIQFKDAFQRCVDALPKAGLEAQTMTRYLLFKNPITTVSGTVKSLHYYINITAPYKLIIASTLLLGDALRWKSLSNFNFSCLAYIVLILGTLHSSDELYHVDILDVSMHSYLPSGFLSFCLAVALSDALSTPMLSSTGIHTSDTVYTYIHIYVSIFMYIYICIIIYVYTYIFTYIYIYVYISIYI
jgi:hypothetical protein